MTVLLEFNDKVREMIEGLADNLEAKFDCESIIDKLSEIIKNKGEVDSSSMEVGVTPETKSFERPSSEGDTWEEEEPVEASAEAIEELAVVPVIQEASFAAVSVASQLTPQKEVPKKEAPKKEARKEDETIRVSISRMDKLNDLVGELAILQTLVENSLVKAGEHKLSRTLAKLCKDVQDLSMSLRMVPVGPSFQKLTRIVRDTSKILGKKVELRIIGEETEIDKTVAESLGDPLVHIIRNAIDHGVESPEERLAAGKPEEGVVEVMAFHEGNFLIIQITDDGKGICGEKLIAKAKAKGIIPQTAQLTEQQGIELIFHPGFSTKDQVSEVSGRGVGMDVVKTNIEELGGEVKVRSKLGNGSCFRLMLPLTLAIIEGMLIESGKQAYVVPKGQIQEVIKIDPAAVTQMTGRVPYLSLRNEVIPLFSLQQDLGTGTGGSSDIAIIVVHGDLSFAVSISDILRQQQVVVKPPTQEIYGRPGIMGTTILSDGKPSIIIDLLSLYGPKLKKELAIEKKKVA